MATPSIHIYKGRANTGKTTACFEEIREILQKDMEKGYEGKGSESPSIIVLVPEPSAYKTERALAEYMPQGGFYNVHVVGFSRLAYKVFQAAGMMDSDALSDVGSSLLLRSIMKKKEQDLTIFRDIAKHAHFADVMKQLIAECHAFTVTAEDLRNSSQKVQSTVLREKLKDIATVMETYDQEVEERFSSPDMLESLAALIPNSPLTKDAYVYIDGYHWFTPQQQKVVNALLRYAKRGVITETLPTDEKEYKRMTSQGGIFQRPRENVDEIVKEFGSSIETKLFTKNLVEDTALQRLESQFFTVPSKAQEEPLAIPLIEAQTRKEEADYIARSILQEMEQDASLRYKDFAVILRDEASYGDDIAKAMERYGIPFFMDKSNPMFAHPLAECMQSLLQVCKSNFEHEALFRLLKTDLFPLTRGAVDELENYVLEFGLHGYKWLDKKRWDYPTNRGMICDAFHPGDLRVERIHKSRIKILRKIKRFYQFAQKEHTGEEWSRRIYQWIQSMHIAETLQSWYDEEEAKGHRQEAVGHGQMYKQLILLLDEIFKVCKDEVLSLDEVALILAEGLGEVKYSVVPPTLDHVTVTSIDRAYMVHFPIVFVPGLNDGVFPKRMGDEGMLRDEERAVLKDLGITLAAGALANALQENFLLYLAFTRPTRKLFLSYATSGLEGESMEPSLVVKRLQQGQYVTAPIPVAADDIYGSADAYIWRKDQAIHMLPRVLTYLEKGYAPSNAWWSLWQYSKEAYPDRCDMALRGMYHRNSQPLIHSNLVSDLLIRNNSDLSGSVTSLEQYNRCPFSYFAKYVLGLEERREKTIAAGEYGSFYHENLRILGEYIVSKNKRWHQLSEEELETLIDEVSEETAKSVLYGAIEENAYMKYIKQKLIDRVRSTVTMLSDWSRNSDFTTVCLEQNFGMSSYRMTEAYQSKGATEWNPIYVPLANALNVKLRGQIDRIDFWKPEGASQTYGLIVDYKSNENTKITTAEVYYGLKMQLMTYLQALRQSQKFLPAPYNTGTLEPVGLLYTYVSAAEKNMDTAVDEEEYSKEENDRTWKSEGFFHSSPDVLQAIDTELPDTASFIPIGFKKDGSLNKNSLARTKSSTEFSDMADYTLQKIQAVGQDIVDGKFPIEPYYYMKKTACQYCKYKTVCQFDRDACSYRYLPKISEEEAMDAMQKNVRTSKKGDTADAMD